MEASHKKGIVAGVIGGLIGCGILLWFFSMLWQESKNSIHLNLHATVSVDPEAISVFNQEDQKWTNCTLGINGNAEQGYDHPLYQTPSDLVFAPESTSTIFYLRLIAADGTRFDYSTHAVTSVVIVCNPQDGTGRRGYAGTFGTP